ncbi:hypothetical protein GCM10027596_36640 [Nocardioides korecus]
MLSAGARSLQEEVDRWRALIDTLPALVALWDRDQRNVMANAAYEEWFGLAPADLKWMHLREVLGASLYALNRPHAEAALRGEQQVFDRTVVTVSGDTRHTQAHYVPHVTADGVQGFYVMVTDISAKVEAERDLLATQALARIGSYTVAPATRTLRLSPELRRMLGFPADGPGPSLDDYLDLVHPEDRTHVAGLRESAVRGQEYEGSYRLVRPDGVVRHVHSRTSRVLGPEGEVLMLRGVMQDVTEVQHLSDELAAHNRLLTDVIAVLGHDLGQPIAVVNGYLEHLVEEWGDVDASEALGLLRRALRAGRRVDALLADVLSFITVESSQLVTRPRPVDVVELVQALAVQSGIDATLTGVTRRHALVDPVHLERIMDNLLVNAGKYGAAPYDLQVIEDGDDVVISVRDHGEGVPAAFAPRLFERFSRADAVGGVTGTGLGLYLVREMARANGGEVVHRDPEDGAGAVFEIRLPAAGDG